MDIRQLTNTEAERVPDIWRAAWPQGAQQYPLEERVWLERLRHHHDPALLLGAFDDGRLIGVAYGRHATQEWQPQGTGWVSLLAVAAPWQGRGVGAALFQGLGARLRAEGANRFHLGGEANHLFPAPPQEALPAFWRLARSAGAVFGMAQHDLHLDLRAGLPGAPLPAGWRSVIGDGQGALAFVASQFPGRWEHELRLYLDAGATVLTLQHERAGSGAEAFCVMFEGHEALLGPSLHWRSALGARGVVGMGPLGVAADERGAGLGLALVRAGALWLKERGATDLVINWTSLAPFYGRLGARIFRTYQQGEGPL